MRPFYLIAFFLSVQLLLFGQNSSIEQLEESLQELQGKAYAATAITLAEQYYKEGDFDEATQLAKDVYEMATAEGDTHLQARALNLEAKAMIGNRKRFTNRRKVAEQVARKFEESLRLLENTAHNELKIDNLEWLQKMAEHGKNRKLVRQLGQQIKLIKEGLLKDPIRLNKDRRVKKEVVENMKGVIKEAQEESLNLSNQVDSLSAQQEVLYEEQALLDAERQMLAEKMKQQKEDIAQLNKEQIEQELLISRQRILVDSFSYNRQLDSLQIAQQRLRLSEQASVLALQRSQRNLFITLSALVFLMAIGLLARVISSRRHNRELENKNSMIQEAQAKSDELLLNILPASIAEELKNEGSSRPRQFEEASVLFTDFKNFSRIAEQLSPEELVADLDYCFKAFDKIVLNKGLEKIKTIGDAYMCAGGLPSPDEEHPQKMIEAAQEMQQFLGAWKKERSASGKPDFEARIGIHSGPLVAGIVGHNKFAYDIWGDTVNIAARMESSGKAGRINISAAVYAKVKDLFPCIYRGKLPIKNKGEIDMYFVEN